MCIIHYIIYIVCMCIGINVFNIHEKEAMNLKKSREGYLEDTGRRERKGKYCNYIIFSKNKRNHLKFLF